MLDESTFEEVLDWILGDSEARNQPPCRSLSFDSDRSVNLMYWTPGRESWTSDFESAKAYPPYSVAGNPHTWQRLADPLLSFPDISCDHPELTLHPTFIRELRDDAPRRVYRRDNSLKSVLHWGQRKLLLSEIEFLTDSLKKKIPGNFFRPVAVVYVGAAPGDHLPILIKMFREEISRWILYDGRAFSFEPSFTVDQHMEFFDINEAKRLKKFLCDYDILLISDIRNLSHSDLPPEQSEISVKNDMKNQHEWVSILKPKNSMLKFRLPYTEGITEYLTGKLLLPIWGPQTTTECRLIVKFDDIDKTKFYDHRQHWEQMSFFNTVTRVGIYTEPLEKHGNSNRLTHGLCHCYDCTAELKVLEEYCKIFSPESDAIALSNSISQNLQGRKGLRKGS